MAITAPARVLPAADSRPVELAVVDSITGPYPPETFLWVVFHRPDGGARIYYSWTDGGVPLGERIDHLALPLGLDACDWLHIGDAHCQHTTRGRIAVQAYALRPVLADVQAGVRGPDDRRASLARVIAKASELTGQTPKTTTPRWLGFGPTLLNQK